MLKGLVLFAHRLDYMWVAMPHAHGRDAGEAVEVTSAFLIPDILPFALHDHQRFLIQVEQRRA